MKEYFKNFPTTDYHYYNESGNKISNTTVDMSIRFRLIDTIMKNPNAYYDYFWKDEDRLDIIAYKYYGDVNLSWLVMLSGEIFDWVYDLPLSDNMLDNYLMKKYSVENIEELQEIVYNYKDISGIVIDKNTYDVMPDYNRKIESVYQYELKLNESKRHIKLISKEHLKTILNEFDYRLQDIKNKRRLYSG